MISRNEILSALDNEKIEHEIAEHPAVFSIDELYEHEIPHRERIAKNLFLRDDKKRLYCIVSLRPDVKADLKGLRKTIGSRPLSFASEEDLEAILSLSKGEVTPFGLLNDLEHRAKLFIDSFFKGGIIGVHPNDNTATVFLSSDDLISILSRSGAEASYIDIEESI